MKAEGTVRELPVPPPPKKPAYPYPARETSTKERMSIEIIFFKFASLPWL
jgi:hypothetical protein